jgi:hypothetical protein
MRDVQVACATNALLHKHASIGIEAIPARLTMADSGTMEPATLLQQPHEIAPKLAFLVCA